MKRTVLKYVLPSVVNVERYLCHLQPAASTKAVQPLHDILPSTSDGISEAYKFQSLLIQKMNEQGVSQTGWKVVPPTYETMRTLKINDPVFAPIFATSILQSSAAVPVQQVQHVELALAFEVDQMQMSTSAAFSRVFPALELTASRYPFYAPHAPGYIADMTSHVSLILGQPMQVACISHVDIGALGMVLTLNDEPQQVGYGKNCLGGPLNAGARLAAFCTAHSLPFSRSMYVACVGLGARAPARRGRWLANFGPLGFSSVTLT